MNIAANLRKIAAKLIEQAEEIEAGHIVPSDDLRLEARKLSIQAEAMDEGLGE